MLWLLLIEVNVKRRVAADVGHIMPGKWEENAYLFYDKGVFI